MRKEHQINQQISKDPLWIRKGYNARFQHFQGLMRHRIRDILLVSSLYDFFIFEEDGRVYELIRDKYQGLNLTHTPEITQVSSGGEAEQMLHDSRFDLVIITLHIEDMSPASLAKRVKQNHSQLPVIMLAFDNKELSDMLLHHETEYFDEIFIWQGDYHLILAIIKTLEDRLNVSEDTDKIGVQSILVIEDNILYYSSLLPMIYIEVMKHSQRLIEEGVNLSHRRLRMRARPKILLAKTYEEAWQYFQQFKETVLGVISDIDFLKNGQPCPDAGLHFARDVKSVYSDIAIMLHSTTSRFEEEALSSGYSFVLKESPTLLQELRRFMTENLSFGDFVFYLPDGHEVGRAHDLLSLEKQLAEVPETSIIYHAERNHFSNWLKARTEFWLAHEIRSQRLSDFATVEGTRQNLIRLIHEYRKLQMQGVITDFDPETFDPQCSLSRLGGGSLGGKARGMSFVNQLVTNSNIQSQFPDMQISIPPAIFLGTDVFDQFLDSNQIRDFALHTEDDQEILKHFLETTKFPEKMMGQLAAFLERVNTPLAVRSSSLLEDSHVYPFAGVYKTYMLANTHQDPFVRLLELVRAIKKVYASAFYQSAKRYVKLTPFRLEEEKMAVVIQKMVGSEYNSRYYPHFSGVAKSYNYYPIPPQKFNDGVVNVALGLGKMVVEGGLTVRFCPKYPRMLTVGSTAHEIFKNSQQSFYALDLTAEDREMTSDDALLKRYTLSQAEKDGTLNFLSSTYSAANDRIYDGIAREGVRLITFAQILKNETIPLAKILDELLQLGSWGMGTPVEIEFAVQLPKSRGESAALSVLQMRPIVLNRELEVFNDQEIPSDQLICQSNQVLGNDIIDNIYDIVLVDKHQYDRSKSRQVAEEVSQYNIELMKAGKPYLLIGVGRWGSMDPWLGIPVTWEQIAGARAIVEAGFKDFVVEPSQGTHFFQNLNSFQIGYFTISKETDQVFIDWNWLFAQPVQSQKEFTRHLNFSSPLIIKMSAHQNLGIVQKPAMGSE
jgi:CheY-like chemotaxis protein